MNKSERIAANNPPGYIPMTTMEAVEAQIHTAKGKSTMNKSKRKSACKAELWPFIVTYQNATTPEKEAALRELEHQGDELIASGRYDKANVWEVIQECEL